jgi:hypothetical protein
MSYTFNPFTGNFDSTPRDSGGGGGQELYDAIVDAAGGADYTDIQSAITAGHKTIYVRKGTYTLSANITFASPETVIVGESWDTVIACTSYQIDFNAQANSVIRNLKITSTSTSNAVYAVELDGDNGLVENCYFDGYFLVQGNTVSSGKTVDKCYVTGGADDDAFLWAIRMTDGKVTNCTIEDYGDSTGRPAAIYLQANSTAANNRIINIGGSSAQYNASGIAFDGNDNVITGNYIDGVYTKSSNYAYAKGIFSKSLSGGNTVITGNYIANIGTTGGQDSHGIFTAGGVVSGNYIENIGSISNAEVNKPIAGIYLLGEDCAVSGNTVIAVKCSTNCYGVYVLDNTRGESLVGGNVFAGFETSSGTRYGASGADTYGTNGFDSTIDTQTV